MSGRRGACIRARPWLVSPAIHRDGADMIEVMIERWKSLGGKTDFLWSVWQDGRRLHMGEACTTPDDAALEARAYCRRQLGHDPDDVTQL